MVRHDPSRPELPADEVQVVLATPQDAILRLAVDAAADGPAQAWLLGDSGQRQPDNRVEGAWRTTADGYALELRIPRSLIGPRLSFAVVDVDDPETRVITNIHAPWGTGSREELATVRVASPEISELLRGLAAPARGSGWWTRAGACWAGRVPCAHRRSRHSGRPRSGIAWPTGCTRSPAHCSSSRARTSATSSPAPRVSTGRRSTSALAGRETSPAAPDARRARGGGVSRAPRLRRGPGARRRGGRGDDERGDRGPQPRLREVVRGRLGVTCSAPRALFVFATRLSLRIRRLRDDAEQAIDAQGRISGTYAARRPATRSATSRAASPRSSTSSGSTPPTSSRWDAASRTRSARPSVSSAPRSTT